MALTELTSFLQNFLLMIEDVAAYLLTIFPDVVNFLHSLTLFDFISWGSALLASISVLVMVYLTLRRIYQHKLGVRESKRAAYLRPLIFKCIDEFSYCDELEKELVAGDRELIILVIRQLMDVLRGEAKSKLVAVLRRFGAIEEHIRNLQDGDWGERSLACLDMAWYQPEEVTVALENALNDSSTRVRILAANSLVTLGVPIDIPNLARRLTTKGSRRPRALRVFFRRIAPDSVSGLISLLEDDEEGLLVMVIDALGKCNDFSVIKKISELAEYHPSLNVRATSMRSLKSLAHPTAAEAIKSGLFDFDWEVRTQAAIAAGKLGVVEAEERLTQLLSDNHWWVRFRSAEALLALGKTGLERLKCSTHKGGLAEEIATAVLLEQSRDMP